MLLDVAKDSTTAGYSTRLTPDEVDCANDIGGRRAQRAKENGWKDVGGFSVVGRHEQGARCEMATAKMLEVPWNMDINLFSKGGEVGPYEVRHATKADHLAFREKDRWKTCDTPYIACRESGSYPDYQYELIGWMTPKEAMANADWYVAAPTNGGKPYWSVPRRALRAMDDLPAPREVLLTIMDGRDG